MKKLFTLLSLLPFSLTAQTFVNATWTAIPNNQTDLFIPVTVQGLPNTIDTSFGLSAVCMDIFHQHMADLKIRLQSPSGTTILLADQRGGSGTGYQNACFQENGSNGFITSGTPPINGSYIPQNSLNTFNTGENPNGTWNLIITDMFNFLDTGSFHYITMTFALSPPHDPSVLFICNTSNAGGCFCPDSAQQNCDLLPDMTASCMDWVTPITESPGYLSVSTATPNIGWGPLEIHGTNSCYCDTTLVPCTTVTCPNGDPPKQMVSQRIYHKNGSTMTFWDRPAGTMAYHPTHGHIHVDDWVWIDARRRNSDPNPTHWPKTGIGTKQSYCLINLGDCTNSYGVCRDDNGNTITQANIPNSNLGSVSGCGVDQGIYVGEYDTYGSIDVTIPPGACNGDYYIISITDPLNVMLEQNDTNNWIVLPFTLTQQPSTASFETAGYIYLISGLQVDFLANSTTADSITWEWGDGTPNLTHVGSITGSHVFSGPGTYVVGCNAYNLCGLTYSSDTINILPTQVNEPFSTLVSWNIYPNPAKDKINIDYSLANSSDVKIEITNAVGQVVKELNTVSQYAGKYHVSLNLSTGEIKQGIYFVRLTSNNKTINERFIVLK